LQGIVLAMKALLAAGAVKVSAPNSDGAWNLPLDPSQPLEERLSKLDNLVKRMRKTGIQKYDFPLFSAHQMGSCRMGSSPK
jgi:choline dehydrogenase-like flavoprotein